MTNAEETPNGTALTPEAIARQLATIRNSKTFSQSRRSRDFLAFVVEQSLQGKESGLKELVVGTELFGEPGFDPKRKSSVRSAANRLREKLNAYYADEGKDDELIITLPQGAYLPRFTLRPIPVLADPPAKELKEAAAKPNGSSAKLPERFRPILGVLRWIIIALGGMVAVAAALAFLPFLQRHKAPAPKSVVQRHGRLFVKGTSEGQTPTHVHIGYEVGWLLVTPDGSTLYAIQLYGQMVTALGVDDLQPKRQFYLPDVARGAVMSSDGRHIYIGSPNHGVMFVDAERGKVERVIPTGGPVFDLAVTPDDKKLFLAMGGAGLERILTTSGEATMLSTFACPLFLNIDGDGKRLFVSYQCGGPGGRDGHDVVEVYDTASEERVGVIRDLPLVGGHPVLSPDGNWLLLDANDACITERYDHDGCPEVPSHLFHLIRTSDRSVVKSFTRPMATYGAAFSPDGSRLILGGNPLAVMDWARQTITETAPNQNHANAIFAFAPSGTRTFVASFLGDSELLVFDAEGPECALSHDGLANQYSGDGTFDDAVGVSALTVKGEIKFAPGLIGQAFQFSGDGSTLEGFGGAACWPCEGNWTESFFAKFNSIVGEMTLLDRAGNPYWQHRVFKTKDNLIVLQFQDPSAKRSIAGSAVVQPNQWYHIALVADGVRRSLYIDGVAQGHVDLAGQDVEPTNRGVVTIGASQGKRAAFHGLLDEITWHERALGEKTVMNLSAARSHTCAGKVD